jgi:DNA-binding CsgD family transcriptional regulator
MGCLEGPLPRSPPAYRSPVPGPAASAARRPLRPPPPPARRRPRRDHADLRELLGHQARGVVSRRPRRHDHAPGLGQRTAPPGLNAELDQLTRRERDVLRLIAAEYTYKEIGTRPAMSARTVEKHAAAVLRKLQLSNRHELSRWARPAGSANAPAVGEIAALGGDRPGVIIGFGWSAWGRHGCIPPSRLPWWTATPGCLSSARAQIRRPG